MSRTEVTNSQMLSMLKLGLELNYIEANRGSVSMPAKRGETTITVLNFQNSDIAFTDGQFQIAQGKEAHPCTGVTWYGAQVYANLYSESLNLKPAIDVHTWECDFMGAGFRLPTESEWEYAHQAGEETNSLQHPSKLPALAADQNGESRPVDTDPKNPWGLVGMDGNVSEWCWDWFGASRHSSKIDPSGPAEGWRKAVRGKHFLRNTEPAQNAVRISGLPFNENKFWGFRIVRTLVEQE